MILKFKKDKEMNEMFVTCFEFKSRFIRILRNHGYTVMGADKIGIVQRKVLDNESPYLKECEAKLLADLIDCTSVSLLDAEPPYTPKEMKFLENSTKFMARYNAWTEKNKL